MNGGVGGGGVGLGWGDTGASVHTRAILCVSVAVTLQCQLSGEPYTAPQSVSLLNYSPIRGAAAAAATEYITFTVRVLMKTDHESQRCVATIHASLRQHRHPYTRQKITPR